MHESDALRRRSAYGGVLSVAKLRVGAEAYQLTGVAQSLDDYYSGSGEAEGWWAGVGARQLGLDGPVAGDDLRAILAGLAPGKGGVTPNEEQIHPHPRRVPGFDLTFKVPKSVSVLYGVSDDPRVQGAIIEAAEAALRETLSWLERDVMAVRRGSGNERFLADLAKTDPAAAEHARIRTVRGAGMAAAVFRHRTSRAGDPLLHWHVLVPNLVKGADGRWSAFVHPDLFRSGKAAGEIFQAAVRQELTERLGLQWRPGRHVPEVSGIPQSVCDVFSKRSAEIDAWLNDTGRPDDPANRQEAVLATRRGKGEHEGERFDAAWKLEGADLGFGPEQADHLVYGTTRETPQASTDAMWRLPEISIEPDGTPYGHDRIVPGETWIADLACRDLCTDDATFTRPELLIAVAKRLGNGATVPTIEAIVSRVLASSEIIPIDTPPGRDHVPRWSTRHMLTIERALLDAYAQRHTWLPVDAAQTATIVAAHDELGADQAAAVVALTASPDAVSVMIGPAGTGKTFTLNVARQVFEAAGYRVIGAAPSARAAAELEGGAHIESRTLHSLTQRWNTGIDHPDARTVLVIDEAAMAATTDLQPLVSRTVDAGGRVVLVGDHHQLPEVTAGGGLAAAVGTVGTVAELTINRRQQQPWERAALAELRAGSVPNAVDAYRAHGRVTVVEANQNMITVAADRYLAALDSGLRPILMAGTNDTVARLNTAVRNRLHERGDLHDVDGQRFAVGERVVLRRNQRLTDRTGANVTVRNSDAAHIHSIGPDGALTVRREADERLIDLPADYAASHITTGYAVTAHRAQGGTWDLAIAVGVDGLYREAAYVQMSRGRVSNELVIPAPQMDDIDRDLAQHSRGLPLPGEEPPEAIDDLRDRLHKSRAKTMALTRDPHADRIAALASSTSVPDLDRRRDYCLAVEREATRRIGIDPAVLRAAVDRAERTALHAKVGQQIKAFDRQNIGTVVGLADAEAAVDVHFISHDGHEATRRLPWTELEIVDDRGPTRILPDAANTQIEALRDASNRTTTEWTAHLDEAGTTHGEARLVERARSAVIDRGAGLLAATQPVWLTDLIGQRPTTPHEATTWDHAVRAIAEHRARREIDAGGLGPEPVDPQQRSQWTALSRFLLETRVILDAAPERLTPQPRSLSRTMDEMAARIQHLDQIFEGAPPDQRELIAKLRDTNQLTLDDTSEMLAAALETQGLRRDWILTNWPHVVEYAEILRVIDEPLVDQPSDGVDLARNARQDDAGLSLDF